MALDRSQWERTADELLDAVVPHFSPERAAVHIPGGRESTSGRQSDGLQGFARTFLLAAFRMAQAPDDRRTALADRYRTGLVAGTDPKSPAVWPEIRDSSPAMAEAAAVAMALAETKPWVWDKLSLDQQTHVVDWFVQIHGKVFVPNNWLWFQVIINAFLASVGAPWRQNEVERNLKVIDSWYRGAGWYTDGPGLNFDHYNGWSMHFYAAMWCRQWGDQKDAERAQLFRRRLWEYLDDARHLIGADGGVLHMGRSLIYRFAAASPFWAGALVGATPLSPGETRRAASVILEHFLERGCRTDDGLLTMGWYREFLNMAQPTAGPASPYAAGKGFVGLLLPPDHETWTAEEAPLPIERGDFVRSMSGPGWLAIGSHLDGIVRVASHRGHHAKPGRKAHDPHYSKLAFSTAAAPDVAPDGGEVGVDNQVVLIDADGVGSWRARFRCLAMGDRFAGSVAEAGDGVVVGGGDLAAPQETERIEVWSVASGGGAEVRVVHVSTVAPRLVVLGGWAVAGEFEPTRGLGNRDATVVAPNKLVSRIVGLTGFDSPGVDVATDANAFGPVSATPWVSSGVPVQGEWIGIAHVWLGRGEAPAVPTVDIRGHQVLIDGVPTVELLQSR